MGSRSDRERRKAAARYIRDQLRTNPTKPASELVRELQAQGLGLPLKEALILIASLR
jgi:hypothetical protein